MERTKLEEKWGSYSGTGVTANKGRNSIALRRSLGGEEFAVVKLIGGCWTNSPMKVLEEIKTTNLTKAHQRFDELAKKLGYKTQPLRTVALLFP